MLPEVETYFTTRDAADARYEENVAALQKELPDGHTTLEGRIYGIQVDAADSIRDAKKDQAWRDLRDSDNKTVAWIVRKFNNDYREHAEKVLRILPATLTQLEDLRLAEGWCGDFTDYVYQAVADGALEVSDSKGARQQLERYLNQVVSYRYVEQTMRLVDMLVKAEVETARETWEADRALTEQATDAENAAAEQEQNL